MKGVAVLLVVVLAVVSLAATPGEAISCGDVQGDVGLCLSYLTGGGEPSESCCAGVRSLFGSIKSKEDRQTACTCFKSAASGHKLRPDSIANLPGKCGVSGAKPGPPDMDCSKIS